MSGAGAERSVRVLGIDPGTSVTGWGVVETAGTGFRCVASGDFRLSSRRSLAARLQQIHSAVAELIGVHAPAAVALEKAFVAHNVQSAFRLGEARGAVLIAAAAADVSVFEYAPAAVKLAVVGYGRADKRQMVRGVALRLGTPAAERADEADALALALCHLIGARWRAMAGSGRRVAS